MLLAFAMIVSKEVNSYTKILLPKFVIILFLFVDMSNLGTGIVFDTVLTVSGLTSLSALGTFPECYIIFARCFSILRHNIPSVGYGEADVICCLPP